MMRRQEGFTLIEILVVITIIAALVGLVTLLIPQGSREREKLECMNNLRQVGALLIKKKTAGKSVTAHSGAAFLLQVAPEIDSGDLKVFLCPGESAPEGRPEPGTDDFTQMFRTSAQNLGKLDEDALRKMSSYAGPNWKDFPNNAASRDSRLWGCDACQGRVPYHPGICCLWDSSKVTFLDIGELEGQDAESIYVGPGSGDKRLESMIFYPKQN